jgi:alkylmercury lyase
VELPARDRLLYAWCAPDALILPALIGQPARVISPCHATNQPITAELDGEAVTRVDPPSAVVSFVLSPDPADLRGTGCDHQNLFVSREAATDWLAAHPDTEVMPVAQAFGLLVGAQAACGFAIRSEREHD